MTLQWIPATRKHPHIPAAGFLVNQLIKMVVRRWETTSKTVSKSHSVQIDFQTSDTTGLPKAALKAGTASCRTLTLFRKCPI